MPRTKPARLAFRMTLFVGLLLIAATALLALSRQLVPAAHAASTPQPTATTALPPSATSTARAATSSQNQATTPTPTASATATASATPRPSATEARTPVATDTRTGGSAKLAPAAVSTIAPNGASSFIGNTDQTTAWSFPLARGDSSYDTIFHVANATGGSNSITATFTNPDGSVAATIPISLNAFASTDLDVANQVSTSFNGSAVIAGSGAISVSADVLNPTINTSAPQSDNFDTYTGLAAGALQAAIQATNQELHFVTQIDLVNTAGTATTATLSIATSTPVSTSVSLSGFGTGQVQIGNLASAPTHWVGPVQIQSGTEPVAAVAEITGNNAYGLVPMSTSAGSLSYFVPRYDANYKGWYTAVVLENTSATSSATFTVTGYGPDGTAYGPIQEVVQPQNFVLIVNSPYAGIGFPLPLPNNSTGSAYVQTNSTQVAVLAMLVNLQTLTAPDPLTTYLPPISPPSGGAVVVPALRVSAGGMQTGLTLMNPDASAQSYQVSYYDPSGNLVKQDAVNALASRASVTLDQGTDSSLQSNVEYQARITNVSGGSLPVTLLETFGGFYTALPQPTATPAATNTLTATPTSPPSSATPTYTPTPVPSDSAEPDENPGQAKQLPLDGSVQQRTFSFLGDQDWVYFNTTQANQTVQLSTQSSTCDTQLYLYESDGATVDAFDDDSGSGFSSQVSYTYPVPGKYFGRVRNYLTQSTGASWLTSSSLGECGYQLIGQLVVAGATATPTASPIPPPSATPTSTLAFTGLGGYLGGGDKSSSYDLPVVRTTSGSDTFIHITNATSGTTTATVSLYDVSGNLIPAPLGAYLPLAPWGSVDLDVAKLVGSSFDGSAIVSATPGSIAVSADVYNPATTSDNFDSYAGLPAATTSSYVLGSKANLLPFNSTIDVQNPGPLTANVTVTFPGNSDSAGVTAQLQIPARGRQQVDVTALSQLSAGYFGAVQIASDQPVAAVSELTTNNPGAPNVYAIGASTSSLNLGTIYVPRLNFSTTGPSTGLALVNSDSTDGTFTINLINPDGSPYSGGPVTLPVKAGHTGLVSSLISTSGLTGLPSWFSGSAEITCTCQTGLVGALDLNVASDSSIAAVASLTGPNASVTADWLDLSGVRNNAGAGSPSSTITVMNPSSSSQSYQIVYWDHNGAQTSSQSLTLKPGQATLVSVASQVPGGFLGSAQIFTSGGGPLPIAYLELAGGYAVTASQPTPTPVVSPTPQGTPVSRGTKIYLPLVGQQSKLPG